MTSANLNRYIKEYLKRQPKTLSMSQIEELVEYDAWLDTQSGLTPRAADLLLRCANSREKKKLVVCQPCLNELVASR